MFLLAVPNKRPQQLMLSTYRLQVFDAYRLRILPRNLGGAEQYIPNKQQVAKVPFVMCNAVIDMLTMMGPVR